MDQLTASPSGVHIGTSGWSYNDWSGVFYPKGVKAAGRLAHYAGVFDTLEINATFYRLPSQAMIDAWNRTLPPDFHLVVKGPQTITHHRKLKDCGDSLTAFWDRVGRLRALRVVLWQLPGSFVKNAGLLDEFLSLLPGRDRVRHAVEFRHASWWDDEVFEILKRRAAALVAVSIPGLPESVEPTTDFLYVRFHGLGRQLYRYDYSREELQAWADRLRNHLSGQSLYAFFNNGYEGNAPKNALVLRELLSPSGSGTS